MAPHLPRILGSWASLQMGKVGRIRRWAEVGVKLIKSLTPTYISEITTTARHPHEWSAGQMQAAAHT